MDIDLLWKTAHSPFGHPRADFGFTINDESAGRLPERAGGQEKNLMMQLLRKTPGVSPTYPSVEGRELENQIRRIPEMDGRISSGKVKKNNGRHATTIPSRTTAIYQSTESRKNMLSGTESDMRIHQGDRQLTRAPKNVGSKGKSLQQPAEKDRLSVVKVLYWFHETKESFTPDDEKTKLCEKEGVNFVEVKHDLATAKGRRKALLEADVVIFHLDFPRSIRALQIPKKLRRDTVYVLGSMESPALPVRAYIRSSPFLDRFNFLWSYNRDLLFHTSYMTRFYLQWTELQRPSCGTFSKERAFSSPDDDVHKL